jgi:hypothetical protein
MRERGFYAEVVERWIPGANIRRDLFGFIDILCLSDTGELVGVQSTSASNLAARITKISESPLVGRVRTAGIRIVAHGWRRKKAKGSSRALWEVREVDCS